MSDSEIPERFLVAFSFAGEQRDLVRSIAELVQGRLGSGTVFFDEWFEHYIAGDDADLRLQNIYRERALLVVPCISSRFGEKPWTRAEHRAIRDLRMQIDQSKNENDAFRILPLRVGDGDVPGIFSNTICPDARTKSIADTATLIINRLRLLQPSSAATSRGGQTESNPPCLYLAECTPDLDDPTKPINRGRLKAFLEDLGWTVLPTATYSNDEYQAQLEKDLQESLAFIQLIGPYPWKRGDFDRLQNKMAVDRGKRRFRYRNSEIDLKTVESPHREFLEAPDIIAGSFEDFKAYLQKELTVLKHPVHPPIEDNPPLVRVVVRSANPDVLWEKAFTWIFMQESILPQQLGPGETLEAKQQVDPCHGFLIACDSAALDDGLLSPREYLEQCRLIQLKQKDAARRPPVALVYWPPPSPSPWAKLLRCTPFKLHRVEGDAPDELDEFFSQVRQVAQ